MNPCLGTCMRASAPPSPSHGDCNLPPISNHPLMKEEGKGRSSSNGEYTWIDENITPDYITQRNWNIINRQTKIKTCCSLPFSPICYPSGWELVRKILALVENKAFSFSLHIWNVHFDPSSINNTCSIVLESLIEHMSHSESVILWTKEKHY